MKKGHIMVGGVSYPCRPTMGAMLRFKGETGKEITELSSDSVTDLCIYLYCCVASACAADKQEFGYTLEEFADVILPEDMTDWVLSMQESSEESEGASEDAKKKAR